MRKINHIIIHHSATGIGDTKKIANAIIKRWGVSPYHYFIGHDGTIVNGLDENKVGGHTMNAKSNRESIGICLIGNFEVNKPTDMQYKSLISIISDIQYRGGKIPISGHKVHSPTKCPGKNVDFNYINNTLTMSFYKNIFTEENPNGSSIFKNIEGAFSKCVNKNGTLNGEEFFYLVMIGLERIKK